MKRFIIVSLLLGLVSLASCDHFYEVESRSYIFSYVEYVGVELRSDYDVASTDVSRLQRTKSSQMTYRNRTGKITLTFKAGKIVNFWSEGEDKELYQEFCEKNNDVSFNKKIIINSKTATPASFLDGASASYPNISSVDFYCDKAFDENHPAGSSLNDIVEVKDLLSLRQYINSGYKDFGDGYKGMISDLSSKDIDLLLCESWDCRFVSFPENLEQVYKITVAVTFETGDTYSDTISILFAPETE